MSTKSNSFSIIWLFSLRKETFFLCGFGVKKWTFVLFFPCLCFWSSFDTAFVFFFQGVDCEYRHSEIARLNPRECWYWLSGSCLNLNCAFRHPVSVYIMFRSLIPDWMLVKIYKSWGFGVEHSNLIGYMFYLSVYLAIFRVSNLHAFLLGFWKFGLLPNHGIVVIILWTEHCGKYKSEI